MNLKISSNSFSLLSSGEGGERSYLVFHTMSLLLIFKKILKPLSRGFKKNSQLQRNFLYFSIIKAAAKYICNYNIRKVI